MIGKTISHYKILEKLGEGGMGVVYKAEDTKLKREVALKFLAVNALDTEDDKKRFLREAQAVAALNHSNIAQIYEIDEADGQTFLAMEYIEGKSIREMLAGAGHVQPLPLDEAIDYATQITAGLQAAHEKGIIHRDIKSANIMVTDKGQVKIMDFGLAKLADRSMITREGTTLGTVAYMSPEQAQSLSVDHRTDVWSLGVVLYEMICGQLPFNGDYEQAIVYSILNEDPEPLTAIRSGVPMKLEEIVNKLLAKEPSDRYQNVVELPVDLKAVDSTSIERSRISKTKVTKQIVKQAPAWQRWLPWSIAALMTFIAFRWWLDLQQPQPKPVTRWNLNLPAETPIALVGAAHAGGGQTAFALSPDGSRLVYVGLRRDEQTQLYLRAFDRFDPTAIPGTKGAYAPFFSPDGTWIGFFADNKIKKVSLQTAVVETLCGATSPFGATWSPDDRIIFADRDGTALSWISASGGDVERIPTLPRMRFSPAILPDGDHVLLPTIEGISVVSLLTGQEKSLPIRGAKSGMGSVRYAKTGHLVFSEPGRLTAVPFDLNQLEVTGQPVPILDNVRTEVLLSSAAQYDFSSAGMLVYVSGSSESVGKLVWVKQNGVEEPLSFPPALYGTYRLSPDGRHLAVAVLDAKWDVYIYDLDRKSRSRLTTEDNNAFPIWTKDGAWVVFSSDRNGPWNLYRKRADGTGNTERLTTSDYFQIPDFFSPDGRLLTFTETTDTTSSDIWILAMDGNPTPRPHRRTNNNELFAVFSPDGRYLAYTSDASGQLEVYLEPYPNPEKRTIEQISVGSGYEPIWSSSGKDLFYHSGNRWMVVSIETESEFRAGQPKVFVEGPYLDIGGLGWDVSKDGRRVLLVKGSDSDTANHLNVVVNWFEELKRLVPGGE